MIKRRKNKNAENRAYQFRLYPTEKQEVLFSKTFGCSRKIYNLMLGDKKKHYAATGKMLNITPARYKNEYPYLREVDSFALINEQLHLEAAYKNFLSGNGFGEPKYKAKHRDKNSYTTNFVNGNIVVGEDWIKLPKLGRVPARIHRTPPKNYVLKSVTVTKKRDETYYASVLYEYIQDIVPVVPSDKMSHIGLDYKSDGLFVASDGTCVDMPHFYRKTEQQLKRAQRKLSHMIESHVVKRDKNGKPEYDRPLSECKNVQKLRVKVAKFHSHVANCRKNFLHKTSAEITNRYELISVESLNMKAMSNKSFGNGKATMDNAYELFLSMLAYKQRDKGHHFVKIDKWYPSSQLCHACGMKNAAVKDLRIRKWECPVCGAVNDRDKNAAINIDNEGLRLLLSGNLEDVGQELPDHSTIIRRKKPAESLEKLLTKVSVKITGVCEAGSSHL